MIPRAVLDVRSNRTRVSVGVAGIAEEDADCRGSGGQLGSEEDGEVGGVWIVGNVVELEVEEEGTGRLECPSKCWAHGVSRHQPPECRSKYCADEDHSDQLRRKNREDRLDALGIKVVKIVMTGSSRVRTTKTCRRSEKTDGTTKVDRSNKFDILNPTKADWRLRR